MHLKVAAASREQLKGGRARRKLHRWREHDGQLAQRVCKPCLKQGVAVVGNVVVESKLRLPRTQGKVDGIMPWLAGDELRENLRADFLRACRQNGIKLGVRRQINFKRAATR